MELGVLGPLQVWQDGAPVTIPGAKPRAVLSMLGLHNASVVSADTLIELLWGENPPRTAAKALQTHISALRRALGDGVVATEGAGWTLKGCEVDASRYRAAAKMARDAAAAGDSSQAAARFEEALTLWRGTPELPDSRRGLSQKTRWIEGHAALVEDRADALLATGRAAEVIGDLEAAVAEAPLRERRWGQLMLALYRAGRQGEALGAYQRARSMLADELGVDPGPELRRLEAAVVAQDSSLDPPVAHQLPTVTRAVTFLLTDIEGSTAAWEANADAMALALARHDELVEQVVTSRGGRLIKTRGEGDATFSVFERPSAAAAAAIELQDAIGHEPSALQNPMRIRVALHTGEVELRDGDYFGRAVNRAARLRSLATGGQILCSGAVAELVIDSLPDDVLLVDLGMRQLKNLPRPEHVFELRLDTAAEAATPQTSEAPLERPALPAVLIGPGPFVGRGRELERLLSAWQTTLADGAHTVLIAGEPGVGKTRLAGEWSQRAYEQGAVVLYGRCDEDLGAPYQPFAEALRSLVPCLGGSRLRGLRGVEALLPLVPGLTDVLPDLLAAVRADSDTERFALFDAVVGLLELASAAAPVVLILDDLHWAAKPTLLLLRHLLRFGDRARVQIVGTYRSTDLDRSHPLAATLADLHRDGTADRLNLSGLDGDDVTAYVAEAGYDDEELANALASVTGGNPFFLIEALRHVDESGGVWDQSTLPQGVREAVSRRLSRLPAETNKALAAAAVVGSRFAVDLVEQVVGDDLVDAFDEAAKAGIVIEEPGGHYRFNHALVRQSLLAELASVRRMRLHQRIATTLETRPGTHDELLAELAYHYFECAWAGNAAKAVEYCRRAADQAMARLAYEGAADFFDRALHALEEIDDELPDRDEQVAELLIARCEALLAAGDVASAGGAVSQLRDATLNSPRLAAWAACFDGQLSMLIHPERLDEAETAVGAAANKLAELDDAAGEAKAHTVHATCLARLGRIGDCEVALDDALTAARRARDHRLVNAVLANAPLAALWGPNPVPRAGGRCLDVVRLLRITTDSPAVEAMSTRCQAVLEAFRGRGAAARRMIDSARRAVTELGLRHAVLEVEQFAGIVELVVDEHAAAEPHLRKAYNGFRRMGLDADTAESAALLGRACLVLGRESEADELCTESERLAGHALKASIAWRTLRARLLSLANDHQEARRVAEAAVVLAERTDALVDHGDACLTLATVLGAAGDVAGARVAAERAVDLYERKGAAALAEKARRVLGAEPSPAPTVPEAPSVEPNNACVQASSRVIDAVNHEAWEEVEQLLAPCVSVESRRKIVGFRRIDVPSSQWPQEMRRYLETGMVRYRHTALDLRGERVAVSRLEMATADLSSGAPQDEELQVVGIDEEGRIALQVKFDVEDFDAALAELDAMHARLEEEQPRARLENAASQVYNRLNAYFTTRDWDAMANAMAENMINDDRRQMVNSGIRRGRDVEIANGQAFVELGAEKLTSTVIATRGARLALCRSSIVGQGGQSGAFRIELLSVVEIDADERLAAHVAFDLDDIDAAFRELDGRYLAGEAAAHAHTWSAVTGCYAALNRREIAATTTNFVNVDHRRGTTPFAPGDVKAYTRAAWSQMPDISFRIEAVYRLSDRGAVVTQALRGTSQEGFEAEWCEIHLMTLEGDLFNRSEFFDEADVDAALARFEELSRPTPPRLENVASNLYDQFKVFYAARDWSAVNGLLADNILSEDRRRPINSGVRHGPEALIAEISALAEVGIDLTTEVVATRGERLVLSSIRTFGHDQGPDGFGSVALDVLELGLDGRFVARIVFNSDDFEAAIAELDARYLAGEATAHAQTWSVITEAYAGFNRRELLPTTPDWVNVDNRRGAAFGPGDIIAYIQAAWDDSPDTKIYIAAVHRLSKIGAVVTHVAHGISQDGFNAEWRDVFLLAVDGDLVGRGELFDEAELETAITKFDQLSRSAPRLENAASQAVERYVAHFSARDWDALAKVLADNVVTEDRRRAANAGIRHGRDAEVVNLRESADAGVTHMTSAVIAVRGERLILTHASGFYRSEEFFTDMLAVVEINSDNQMAAVILFDLDDFDSAIAELDARYLTGEAAPYARTWSMIASGVAAVNRHELPPMSPDCVSIDHRRVAAFGPGEGIEYLRAGWELGQDIRTYVEVVHRLTDLGAVYTHAGHGVSREGFNAEWRGLDLLTVNGEMVNRCEVFDEADLDAAVAKFEQLSQSARRLENAASQTVERYLASFAARDWDALADVLANDMVKDDRRRIVNEGVRHGRDAEVANMRVVADAGAISMTFSVIAVRGERLILAHASGLYQSEEFLTDMLAVVEIDFNNQIAAIVIFDLDDFDSATAELDARYLAGEAAPYARTWSVITKGHAAANRQELPPMSPDCVSIDHRRGAAFAPGELTEYFRAGWDLGQDVRTYVEVVHRLAELGAVCTHAGHGVSREGFDAEWRGVDLLTVNGDMVNRCEVFDEAELDAAIENFHQLRQSVPRLENAASQAAERYVTHFAARDWGALGKVLADDIVSDDRRRVVNAGIRRGREAEVAAARASADAGLGAETTYVVTASREERLILARVSTREPGPERFLTHVLIVTEVNSHNEIAALVTFDIDDIDAAFEELDARYLAGEAAPYAQIWSATTSGYAALNRHELPPTTRNWVNVDHRPVVAVEAGDLDASIRALWEIAPQASLHIEAVHRLSNVGVVLTHAVHGTSQEGFDAEWRDVILLMFERNTIDRCEVFDETDLDAALAQFDELHIPQLKNVATQTCERIFTYYAARDWESLTEIVADDVIVDDRRRVVNAGIRRGRDSGVQDFRAAADIGFTMTMVNVVATRGGRLAITRVRAAGRDPETIQNDAYNLVEVDADGRNTAWVIFDLDDIDAATDELDRRYLAGEAAIHARTWSVIAGAYAALNRREHPATTPDWVNVDHRRGVSFAPGDVSALLANWNATPELSNSVEAVHRLSDLGAVVTSLTRETSHEGFEAEWRALGVLTVDGDLIDRLEVFDEADLDAALARFDELSRPAPQLVNAASEVYARLGAYFGAGDWAATAKTLAADMIDDDRRRMVNAGIRRGRDVHLANIRAVAEIGAEMITSTVVATRGARLALCRSSIVGRNQQPGEFRIEFLSVIEIDAYEQLAAHVAFDLENISAAFEELDARYLAGEAAAHAHTWLVVAGIYASFNGHELPAADWVTIDHRRGTPFASTTMIASIRAIWDLTPELTIHIEAVHRLSKLGAVITHKQHGTSGEGFDAEWRQIQILTVDGNRIDRCEIFDEEDLDAALERFDELSRSARRLENTASRKYALFMESFAARDWDAMTDVLADNMSQDDRRRVVNSGIRHGREVEIADMRALARLGVIEMTSAAIAVRGERLALCRIGSSVFQTEVLNIVEIDTDERIAAVTGLDVDDIDAAFKELDARYLAGEAAAHSRTWSVITRTYAAFNQHELASVIWVVTDHRPGALFASSNMAASVHAFWDQTPDLSIHIEAVHRLSDFGAVVTHAADGTSSEGFTAEWRMIQVLTVEGDQVVRCEIFDEADLDAALARFDGLSPPARKPETPASQVARCFSAHFAARDWESMAEILAADISVDDRRRGINAGVRRGREAAIEDLRASVDAGFANATVTVIATRGERLALTRFHVSEREQRPQAFQVEVLHVFEIDSEGQTATVVVFDLDDIDAAFAELDARYLAGEAAAYAHTWSVITEAHAAFNRHEIFTMAPDLTSIDHRRVVAFAPGEFAPYVQATLDVAPYAKHHIDVVHRLSNLGVLVTQGTYGTSQEGFDAEWREIALLTVDGDLINRCEIFEEEDLDAALARFDELSRPARLENMASQVAERYWKCFSARDWAALAQIVTEDFINDDRRRLVGAGSQEGSKAVMADMRVIADLWIENVTTTVIATRGQRLALMRIGFSSRDQGSEAFVSEVLGVGEINTDERLVAGISFDSDDLDAALAELDSRYLAGEAAPYSDVWSVIMQGYAALNRHEHPVTTTDWVNVDHRRGRAFPPGDLPAYLDASWELMPQASLYVAAVHRLSNVGAVIRQVVHGRTREGFDAEWGEINVLKAAGDRVSGCELFDEEDFDAALTRFDELQPRPPRVENAASRAHDRFFAYARARNWAAMAGILNDNSSVHDRRRVVNIGVWDGRDVLIANFRALAEALADVTSTAIATRGERLVLTRISAPNRDPQHGDFDVEMLGIAELDTNGRLAAHVLFDVDDSEAAFAELDARYLGGEAAAYAHTWSVIARQCAVFNRHELPAADWLMIDHRQLAPIDSTDLPTATRAVWDLTPDLSARIEAVHRLSSFGAVVTYTACGTSPEGFDAEWRMIEIVIVEAERTSRFEIFDEPDIDAALARFEELRPQTRRPENTASQVTERFWNSYAARNWDAMAESLADGVFTDDRRRIVNAGVQHGRDDQIANLRALAEVEADIAVTIIATRGHRLVLARVCSTNHDLQHGEFDVELLAVAEIDAERRISATISFDPDDFDAAFAELDARYLAGEAAAYARTWSATTEGYAALNRHEIPHIAPDIASIDHRRGIAFAPGEIIPYTRGAFDIASDIKIHIEVVHRLDNFGAVFTHAAYATSHEGFNSEWREIALLVVDGDLVSRCEIFDETDLDAALARFDELCPDTPRLGNAATQVEQLFNACFAARDWAAMAEVLSDDILMDDRRHVVNAGVRRGRDAEIASERAVADVGVTNYRRTVIAIRGGRLALSGYSISDGWSGSKVLCVSEINAENQLMARVAFDPDDIDAAFAELDARYLAGEAATHAHTWSAIMGAFAALNRHEVFGTTPDWIHVDRRLLARFEADDLAAYLRATWDVTPDIKMYVEAVHQLSDVGAVLTHAAEGTSPDGFDAEWRMVLLLTVEGDLINRGEIFDEENLDAALARFEELSPKARRLENAASRAHARLKACIAAQDWIAATEILADGIAIDDRRRVVNSGIQYGREAAIADMRGAIELGLTNISLTVTATRGDRLELSRTCISGQDQPEAFRLEFFSVVEIGADERIVARVAFDPDDIDAAFEELDSRYLAGEAAVHSQTWSAIRRAYAAANRNELPATTSDWVNIDHRRGRAFGPGELEAYLRATWEVIPDTNVYIESVHRLGTRGAVVTHAVHGTSRDGFDAEWREISLLMVDADRFNRTELFDEADLEAALARFEELDRPTPPLENVATRVRMRTADAVNLRDMEGVLALNAVDARDDDRRKGLRDERAVGPEVVRAIFEAPRAFRLDVAPIAIRDSTSP